MRNPLDHGIQFKDITQDTMGNVHVKKREVTRPYANAHLPRVNWEAEKAASWLDGIYK
jgi:hypothetical protein